MWWRVSQKIKSFWSHWSEVYRNGASSAVPDLEHDPKKKLKMLTMILDDVQSVAVTNEAWA